MGDFETKWNEVGQKLSSIDDNSQENILDSIMGEYKDTPEFAAILRQLRMGTGPTAYTIFKNRSVQNGFTYKDMGELLWAKLKEYELVGGVKKKLKINRLYKKRRNTKRKNTKRRNTKRRNTKRRNTKRRNTKRRNTKKRNTKRRV